MKKVSPVSKAKKHLARGLFDALSAVVITLTISALATCGFFAVNKEKNAVSAAGSAIYKIVTDKDAAGLMFNVYEGTDIVLEILQILRNYSAKATFFIGGIWAEKNSETLLKIAMDGHELACHGYLHKDHSKLSTEQNKEEIAVCCNLIRAVTGETVHLFAPPSGAFGEATEKACAALGLKVIMWTKDTIDWRDSDVGLLVKRATKNISKGDLVLMHPKPQTTEALPLIIERYQENGFCLQTVSEILNGH